MNETMVALSSQRYDFTVAQVVLLNELPRDLGRKPVRLMAAS